MIRLLMSYRDALRSVENNGQRFCYTEPKKQSQSEQGTSWGHKGEASVTGNMKE